MLKPVLSASLAALLATAGYVTAAESTTDRTNALSRSDYVIDARGQSESDPLIRPRSKAATPDPRTDREFPDRAQRESGETAIPRESAIGRALTGPEFVQWFAAKNHLMTSLARLGEERADRAAVRDFAERMMTEHQGIDEKLNGIARSMNVTLEPDQDLDSRNTRIINGLENMPRAEFDAAFIRETAGLHAVLHKRLEYVARNDSRPELKAWANDLLPVVSEHHQAAVAIADDMKIRLDDLKTRPDVNRSRDGEQRDSNVTRPSPAPANEGSDTNVRSKAAETE